MENLKDTVNKLEKRVQILENKLNELLGEKTKKVTSTPASKMLRDKTKYMLNGKVYPKNRLVLAVIKDYVSTNPKISYEELNKVFDKSLQGSLGVVRLFLEVEGREDVSKRFFTKDIISLGTGEKVVVCTQWGAFNIDRFILRAKGLGFAITELN
ncbi:MAG: hypothetical protein ACOX6H_04415 [Christensenellales bacterium]|jgi:hypothetical protein